MRVRLRGAALCGARDSTLLSFSRLKVKTKEYS
jgi:hypothetical protein